jgi:polysaccharide export outer membrane protein
MKIRAILLLSFAVMISGQTPRRLTPDQFPGADPSAVAPLVNVTELPANSIANQPSDILPSQKLGPGDLLSISVSDCPDLTRSFRINSAGLLRLQLLKEPIVAAGKEPSEIEDEIQRALIKQEILVQPVVSVSVTEYRSVPVTVTGAVKKGITFQAVGNVTLIDALSKAEGLAPEAGSEVIVTRPKAPGAEGPALPLRISLNRLMVQADPTANIRLFGGEEIRVPPAGKVYVVGNVKKPGVYSIQDNSDSSVFTALAMSEGELSFTSKRAFIYRRETGKADRIEIPIELSKIMDRKGQDFELQANDILYIPVDKNRRLTSSIIERIVGFGTSTGTGLLVWH